MIKYKTIRVTLPDLSAADVIVNAKDTLGKDIKKCTGVAFRTISNPNNDEVDIALLKGGKDLLDTVPMGIMETETNVPVKDRFVEELAFDYNNEEITFNVTPVAALTDEVIVDVIFKLDTNC